MCKKKRERHVIDTNVCVNPVEMLDGFWGGEEKHCICEISVACTHTQNGMYNVKIYI